MSVRAYRRLAQPQLADSPTFNLWSDNGLYEDLAALDGSWVSSTEDSITQIEINIEQLQGYLADNKIDKDIKEAFENDIRLSKGEEYIFYECY